MVWGMVGGSDTVELVGTKVDEVGGSVVVVSGGAVVVVCAVVWVGGDVPVVGRGAVVLTGGCVPVVAAGATVATVVSAGVEVEVDGSLEDVVGGAVEVVARAVVEDDWVATCCLGELSVPVATSNRRAARATAARA